MAGESRWSRVRAAAQNFFEEKGIESEDTFARSRLHRFAHFCLLVVKSFHRNRCPVRAASLAYTTLLALVPMLAVAVSITTSMLQKQGKEPIDNLISQMVDYVAPALDLEIKEEARQSPTNSILNSTNAAVPSTNAVTNLVGATIGSTNSISGGTNTLTASNTNAIPAGSGREKVVNQISGFIANINSGTLGATSVLALLFVAISLLRTIEATFNDIWGVTRARGWVKSIFYYWTTITLGPLLLVGAVTLNTGPYLESTTAWLDDVPFVGSLIFRALPFVILSLGFSIFYAVMPNTKVHMKAALVGGIVGGCLWQLNNIFSIIYVSRLITYTNIYGSLGVFPLFLVGLYFSWLIMLLGAQVAYAFQNRQAYIQEKQAESVNQRGREFIALRLMTHIARNFSAGGRPLSLVELSRELAVPSQLAQKILCALVHAGLVVEATDTDQRFTPGRPLDRISAYDIVSALRLGSGHELATSEDESRLLVRAEFERMLLAEREAGSVITMQSLAELTAKRVGDGGRPALSDKPS